MNYPHSFRTENKLRYHEKLCKNKVFCEIILPTQKDNTLIFNQYIKSDKTQCIIYADLKSLIKIINNCKNNPEKSSTIKVGEHILWGYSMPTIWALDNIENKHSLYRGEDSMKNFSISLREHAANVINFEKKNTLPITDKELKSHQDSNVCYICRKKILKKTC